MREQDLASRGLGLPWGHTRSYGNRVTDNSQGVNGSSWFVKQMPRLAFVDPNNPAQGTICAYGSINRALWFDYQEGNYVGRFGIKQTLRYEEYATNQFQYVLTDTKGRKTLFFGHDTPVLEGKFKSYINASGGSVGASYDEEGRLLSVETDSEPGNPSWGYFYDYYTEGELVGTLQSATYKVNGINMRRSRYEYYGGSDENGSLGDLKTVRIDVANAAGNQWTELRTSYYRYYLTDGESGFQHGLKYVVGPEAYARMLAASIIPETASDEQIATYADHYFEYNEDRRVTLEEVDGGTKAYSYSYELSTHSDGYNSWKMKTVETLPDGNQNIVYTNYAGQVMLKVFVKNPGQPSEEEWYQYNQYGDDQYDKARVILKAESSAVSGYDPDEPDLGVELNETAGLIHTYDYYTDSGEGAAPGYLRYENVKQGGNGTPIQLRELLTCPP